MAKRRTGLGTDAFFQTPEVAEQEPVAQAEIPKKATEARTQPKEEPQQEPKHVRTTVRLLAETFAALEMLKVQARRRGSKITYGDILNEAVKDLVEKKGITV